MAEIADFLEKREKQGLLRLLHPASSRGNGKIYLRQKEYFDFSSNDYLGLSNHPKLILETKKALDSYGVGSCASRLLSGDLEIHHRLEEEAASFKGKEAALVFNSGYQANLGIISALYKKGDSIFSDRLNHASIIDGIFLSGAKLFRFAHNDTRQLEELLKKERPKFKNALIVTETVFSMDGDICPLGDLVNLKEKYGCKLFVDEAHATGIFGRRGSGLVEEVGLSEKVDFVMGTFGKALGGFGAYLAGSRIACEYLVNASRSFIYSTSLPASIIAANLAGINLIRDESWRRETLLKNAEFFRQTLKNIGFEVKGSSQIVPLIIGDSKKTAEFALRLQERGWWVLPIRPPTVPQGQARLRFSLTLHHNKEILRQLIEDLREIGV
jgi:8-amino-7-oxononanoate synthase